MDVSGDRPGMSRREALRISGGAGLGLLLSGESLWAILVQEAEGQAAQLASRPIPSSGERIPVVGIGTARRYNLSESGDEYPVLRQVLADLPRLGGKVVDTAPSYGQSEELLGRFMKELGNRDRLFLATKVGRGGHGREAAEEEMNRSFQLLGTDRLDLMQVHNLNGWERMLPLLREWKASGRIRYYGVTVSSVRHREALETILATEALDFVQLDYAIDNRGAEERLLPLAADRGVAVLVNLPFGRGRVFELFGDRPLPGWARELGIRSWAQFALKYVLSHPAVTCVIPGTARPEYLADNLAAGRGPFPDAATRRRMVALVDAA